MPARRIGTMPMTPAEPGAVLAALKTKPPAAVARPLGGPVLTAAARGAPPAPGRDGETVPSRTKELGVKAVGKRDCHACQ